MNQDPTEEALSGGNVAAAVVRIGDTVRRPAAPWTPAVHALLEHLHEVGFTGAPCPLGLDVQGREVLTFAEGTPAWPDEFHRFDSLDQLTKVAHLVRDFHDAVRGFVAPPDAHWQTLIPAEPPMEPGESIIAHHDLAPWNLVLGPRWVIIDWDVAAPGTRLWDLAYALKGFVPLSADPHWQRPDAARRMRTFVDAYGLDEAGRRRLVPMLARRIRAMHDFLAVQSAARAEPWSRLWEEGHGEVWRADAEYAHTHEAIWLSALID